MKGCRLSNNTRLQKKYQRAIHVMDQELLSLGLSRPALRALVDHKITFGSQLKSYSSSSLLSWHGIGPSAIKKLRPFLKDMKLKK